MNVIRAAPDDSNSTDYEPVDCALKNNNVEHTKEISAAPASSTYMTLKVTREPENTFYQSLLPSNTTPHHTKVNNDDDSSSDTALTTKRNHPAYINHYNPTPRTKPDLQQ